MQATQTMNKLEVAINSKAQLTRRSLNRDRNKRGKTSRVGLPGYPSLLSANQQNELDLIATNRATNTPLN